MQKIPKLIYGTAWKKEHTADLVEMALVSGFRAIDTACQPKHYEEALVGEGIARVISSSLSREDLFIQTKFTPLNGQDPNRVPYDPNLPLELQVASSFEVSIKNLRTDYLDSLVLHSPLFPYTSLQKVWDSFENIYKNGGTKALGISNCYELELLKRLYDDATIKPAFVQNRFYSESGYDRGIRDWCDEVGVIYQSFWSLTANPHVLASRSVVELALKYNMTQAQIFYRFLSHKGIVPLIGSTSKEHIEQDLKIFEFELTSDEVASIDKELL